MPNYTDNLELFKYDVEADKKSTFNIGLALNDNFDKIDAKVGEMETQQANIDLSNLSTTGNSKLNAKANIDLSNLSTTGEKRFEDINTQIAKTVLQSDLYDSNGHIKIDRILKEKYSRGSSWYRVYSDKWCEQGGVTSGTVTGNFQMVTFLKSFANLNYMVTYELDGADDYQPTYIGSRNRTKTSVEIISRSANVVQKFPLHWTACGYIS